jgi:hypothetical protein
MGQMTTGGIPMENLQEKELDGNDGIEDAIPLSGVAHVDTSGLDSSGLQLRRPVGLQPR